MFLERIRQQYDRLTPGFRQLADFITDNTLEAAFLTATELARITGVDPATVVRFSQELGYSGYRELSHEIKTHVHDQIAAVGEPQEGINTAGEITWEVARASQFSLQRFFNTEISSVARAAEILSHARCIWLTGEYISADVVAFMQKALAWTGISNELIFPDKTSLAHALSRLQEDDVLLALSSVDAGFNTGTVVQAFRARNIHTVVVTGSALSIPARAADYIITLPLHSQTGVPSFAPLFLVMALLWEILSRLRPEQTKEYLSAFAAELKCMIDN